MNNAIIDDVAEIRRRQKEIREQEEVARREAEKLREERDKVTPPQTVESNEYGLLDALL